MRPFTAARGVGDVVRIRVNAEEERQAMSICQQANFPIVNLSLSQIVKNALVISFNSLMPLVDGHNEVSDDEVISIRSTAINANPSVKLDANATINTQVMNNIANDRMSMPPIHSSILSKRKRLKDRVDEAYARFTQNDATPTDYAILLCEDSQFPQENIDALSDEVQAAVQIAAERWKAFGDEG